MFFKYLICFLYIGSAISAPESNEGEKNKNILARKKKFLNELEKAVKESFIDKDEEKNDEEFEQLIENIQNAAAVLSGISGSKISNNKKDKISLLKKINEFNKKMKQIEESYKNLINNNKLEKKSNKNILEPINNNFQQETELNWERKVRFDEFKHPLAVENIEMSLKNKEEILDTKKIPDIEISETNYYVSNNLYQNISEEDIIKH